MGKFLSFKLLFRRSISFIMIKFILYWLKQLSDKKKEKRDRDYQSERRKADYERKNLENYKNEFLFIRDNYKKKEQYANIVEKVPKLIDNIPSSLKEDINIGKIRDYWGMHVQKITTKSTGISANERRDRFKEFNELLDDAISKIVDKIQKTF